MTKYLKNLTPIFFISISLLFPFGILANEDAFIAEVPPNSNIENNLSNNNLEPLIPSDAPSATNNAGSNTNSVSGYNNATFTDGNANSGLAECPAREPVGLIFDHTFSQIVGAEAIITAFRGYELLDDALIPSTAGNSGGWMIAGRAGKAILESLLSTTAMVTQHEVFGHGARAREFHVDVDRYEITPFGGSTSFNSQQYSRLSPSEKMAFIAGGMEGSDILARQLRNRWFRSQVIDSREANLYLWTYLDQTGYILGTKGYERDKTMSDGHDVGAYVDELNAWNRGHVLTHSKLRKRTMIDYLNPYVYYSLYSLGLYIIDGCQSWEYPMLAIGDYKYLPMFRLVLAPYGPEYQFINLIKGPEHNIIATLRYGNTGHQHSMAAAVEVSDLLTSDCLFIDGKAELWNQPKLFTRFASGREKLGAAASFVARYKLLNQLYINGQVGYKTTGFMPGEELKHGPILRIGFLMNI
jgi:hypothetical protein